MQLQQLNSPRSQKKIFMGDGEGDLQGVSQYFGHLEICNFSASGAPGIKIFDIFRKPGQFWFPNYPYL